MKRTLALGLLLSSSVALAVVGGPGEHSTTAGPESTDIMGGGTPGGHGPQGGQENYQRDDEKIKDTMNSQQRMEERNNNSSIQTRSRRGTASDGRDASRKDTRKQGEHNRDNATFPIDGTDAQ
jgi:hypothetical protein